ncbi:MAG: class I SAM-dependent methyltransferase [Oligoflexus sp.]
MKAVFPLAIMSFLAACTPSDKSPEEAVSAKARALPSSLEAAVNSPFRSEENRKRDQYRHPKETLEFFGIQPYMTVVEITPGAGWYTEILAPYLSAKGTYTAAVFPAGDSEYRQKILQKFDSWVKAQPELKVKTSVFGPPEEVNIAPAGSADMVLTFRNVHNWMGGGNADAAFAAFYKALKPGGVLGVVEHRANEKKENNPRSGYVKESEVIRMAEKAGFKLDAKSEVNANPKDSKDYDTGVWTLPPTLRKGDEDRAKYVSIGESDRMTLRFVKPKNS